MSGESSRATVDVGLLACEQCDKRFTRPENLTRHMKTHESIRRHSCSTCGKQFTRSDLRKKHESLHQRSTLIAPASKRLRKSKLTSSHSDTSSSYRNTEPPLLSHTEDQSVSVRTSGEVNSLNQQAQAQSLSLDENFTQGPWTDQVDLNPYFDYSSFVRPWNYCLENSTESSDWFSSQFIAALRETDLAYSPPVHTWTIADHRPASTDFFNILGHNAARISISHSLNKQVDSQSLGDGLLRNDIVGRSEEEATDSRSTRTSRNVSPPNESSFEDRLPFAWDPRSKPIVRAKPIRLAPDDPIFASIDQKVEITQASLLQVGSFLMAPGVLTDEDTFVLPDLPLVNVFVSLFFGKFLPQAPVLHQPTLSVQDLPPALLAIIIVIGSCYSRLRNTRRFGIIVFDRIRRNLLARIEEDNSLMREPFIIYAAALVCYMGLWCGNKRAFELSEAFRAVVVTYIRRLPENIGTHEHDGYDTHLHGANSYGHPAAYTKKSSTAESRWYDWIEKEGQKRLRWFVYMIDMQFPSILGMSSMLTTADVRRWQCPCDESFWMLGTARSWTLRLGSASEPACPVFGSIVASMHSTTVSTAPQTDAENLPNINAWSASLLLTAILGEVFHYQDMLVVLRTYDEHLIPSADPQSNLRKDYLVAKLDSWYGTYHHHQIHRLDPTSVHIHHCSTILYYLAQLYIVFPISDIQDCLGRSGPTGSQAAMARLNTWIAQNPAKASGVVEDASTCISIVMSTGSECDPHDIIGLFLCHVIIWAFAHAARSDIKEQIVQTLRGNSNILAGVLEVVEAGFSGNESAQLIFRHAIHSLAQLGDWGASSNLALLLHLHPGT